jgi:hypothetical protein
VRCSDPFGKINAGGPSYYDTVLTEKEMFVLMGRPNFTGRPSQYLPRSENVKKLEGGILIRTRRKFCIITAF